MIEDYSVRALSLRDPEDRAALYAFLRAQGLRPEDDLEAAFGILDADENLAGCGCAAGDLLKCFAVAESLRGQNALGPLVSALVQERFAKGFYDLFIVIRSANLPLFTGCGFYEVAHTDAVALLENRPDGPEAFARTVCRPGDEGLKTGAVVMNADPFTLGHRYLLEQAAAACDLLYVFVLEEDRSFFPARDRLALVAEGTQDMPNVRVHAGGRYMISSATFPTYFLKSQENAARLQAELDAAVFAERIAPSLHVSCRFVGEEPLDPVTAWYNEALTSSLPRSGTALICIPRLEKGGSPVSASRVRALLRQQGLCPEVRALVPEATYAYLERRFGDAHETGNL